MFENNKFILNCVLIFSILSLFIAYFVQYILGHLPCNLCLIERIPYIAAVILISLMFLIRKYMVPIISIVLIFFIFGALISFYHVGIEQGLIDESLLCIDNSNESLSKEQLLEQLKNTPVSCKDVTFRFLGLSLATINAIISLILSGIMIKVLKNYGKNK